MSLATKDGAPDQPADQLLANSYMGRHVVRKPEYWGKILELLYRGGRARDHADAVEDVVDKFSFLLLAKDQLLGHERSVSPDKRFYVKFLVYNYVFLTKALLDSLAVFVNDVFQLGFRGGQIDLKRGMFIDALEQQDSSLTSKIRSRKSWIDLVVRYRDNLIHRHGLYIGPLPTVPQSLTDSSEIDHFIMRQPHYMPTDPDLRTNRIANGGESEFIKVQCLVDEWLEESFALFDAVLRTFALRFERIEGGYRR